MVKRKQFSYIALAVTIASFFFYAVSNLETGHALEGKELLEENLRKAAVSCYAAEGVYPPDLDYIQKHYGIQIDQNRYAVHYEVFASNLMPDITVLEVTR